MKESVAVPGQLLDGMECFEQRHVLWISEEDVTAAGVYFNIIDRIELPTEEIVKDDRGVIGRQWVDQR